MARQKATRKEVIVALLVIGGIIGLTAIHIAWRGGLPDPPKAGDAPHSLIEVIAPSQPSPPASQPTTQPTN